MDPRAIEKLDAQRSYALRYVESMQTVERKLRGGEGMVGSGGNGDTLKYAINRFPSFLARVVLMAGTVFICSHILKEASQKLGEKYKFEIKTA